MARVSLKMKRKKLDSKPLEMPKEDYPYGTRVDLNSEVLDRLGFSLDDYSIGDKVTIDAVAEIVSMSSSDSAYGEPSKRMELQIKEMDLKSNKKGLK